MAGLRPLVLLGAFMIAPVIAPAALAHHSFAMFDAARTIEIKGEVKEFQWVHPHTWIQILVTDPKDKKVVEWGIEGRDPNVLRRRGWTSTTIKPGEKVTLVIHPLKDGRPGGAIVEVRWADGRKLDADTPDAVDPDEQRKKP